MSAEARPCLAILDDDAGLCSFFAETAERVGYRSVVASDGSSLHAVLRESPEILMLDLAMAGVDGIEVIRQLAAAGFQGRLVIVSGQSQGMLNAARMLAEMQSLRVAATLTKPIRAETITALLTAVHVVKVPISTAVVSVEDLARGIAADELVVFYQPQVRLSDGGWVGVEALVRWRHPILGLLPPSCFIDLAERSELALPLTEKVLAIALRDCALAKGLGYEGSLSINLPPAAMVDLKFPESVVAAQAHFNCSQTMLQFEITETSVPPNPAMALDILARLRLKGFSLSIDDFGTGHSSLEQLQQLPFSELKIDLGFIKSAKTDAKARVIVENSISLGRQLGLCVLAEGVEDEGSWNWLRASGCELAQGYFIAKPLPIHELRDWAKNWMETSPRLFSLI
jgi:EAL domain-containing protein (putative c-di-GMP-specific phosphodiesterase class I)/ActR/RegA family two-component response regulator